MPTKTKPKPKKPARTAPVGASAPPADPPPRAPQPAGLVAPPVFRPLTLALAHLRASLTNPRKTFDEAALAALAASLRASGLAQSLVVRPHGAPGGPAPRWDAAAELFEHVAWWEVVCGERRRRAAGLAGLREVPVRAALLTDEQVLTLQLVENDQREDVKPSERAVAYAQLHASGKRAEDISAETGLPLSAVRDLVRLARLPAWLLAAVDAGEVPYTTAALVAGVPGEESRRRAAACVLLGIGFADQLDTDPKTGHLAELDSGAPANRYDDDRPLTFAETKRLLEDFRRQLKGQPWRKALDLVPGAGACEPCPKRAGNDPAAAADGARADVCLDPDCFAAKAAAWGARTAAAAEKKGRTVVSGEAADGVFHPRGGLAYNAPYYEPDAKCYYSDAKGRTFAELLKGKLEPTLVIDPATGRAHDLYPKAAAAAALKAAGVNTSAVGRSDSDRREEAARRRKQEIGRRAAALACAQVAGGMAAAAGPEVRAAVRRVELLQQLAATVADMAGADACRLVGKRRGLSPDPNNCRQCVEDFARACVDEAVLLGLIAELAAARRCWGWAAAFSSGHMGDDERALWAAFKVDRKALEATAAAELKEKAVGKGKDAKPKPAPAAARTTKAPAVDRVEPPPGTLLESLDDLPAAVLDALYAAGCMTVEQAWSAALEAAGEGRNRPAWDVWYDFLRGLDALDGTRGVSDGAGVLAKLHPKNDNHRQAEPPPAADPTAGRCRVCGCTNDDCRQCIAKTGRPCSWVEPDLCSACMPTAGELKLSAVEGITAADAACLSAVGLRTLADLERACGGNMARVAHVLGGWGGAFTSGDITRIDAAILRHLIPAAKPAAAEPSPPPAKFYGWDITYETSRGETLTCHYAGTEAAARRKAMLKPFARNILKAEGFTEEQWVRAFGRGRM